MHWCVSSGRVVFLDVEADRYFCLPSALNGAFLRLAAGQLRPGDADVLHKLAARGLLIEASGPFQPPATIETPACDYLDGQTPPVGLLPILRALAWEMRAAWRLRTRPFHRLIERTEEPASRSAQASGDGDGSLRAIVSAANSVAFLTRAHNRCLVRARAVDALCRTHGIRPKLVFGVIAHPFAAHCWVQLGSTVLVGGFEQARLHTPILVLE